MNRDARNKALYLPSALRPLAPHMHTIALGLAALILLGINVFFPAFALKSRIFITDLFSPLLNVASAPADAAREGGLTWHEWFDMRAENKRLAEENAKLKAYLPLAQQYEAENKSLRGLMKYKDDSVLSFLTARIIAQPGGNFTNSAIVTAGARDGVRKDMIALGEDGVVGRVIEVGEWSSRILLLQDLSFRLPVQLDDLQVRAILSGEGDGPLQLLFVPKDIELKPGMRISTSGHGGIFPPHMPVGVIQSVEKGKVSVTPYARFDRLHMVRLARYDLAGGLQNTLNQPVPAMPVTMPVQAPAVQRTP
jgi:rod shape-determining protein MreC